MVIKAKPNLPIRTETPPGQSNHNYGLAIDLANAGKNSYEFLNSHANSLALSLLAEEMGLVWGRFVFGNVSKTEKERRKREGKGDDPGHFEIAGNNWRTLIKLPKDENGCVILNK